MKVLGILGYSYCGSTVTNYLLNTGAGVYGGSELMRLRNNGAVCASCRSSCSYWTPTALERLRLSNPGEFYSEIGQTMSVDRVVDSSKLLRHFGDDLVDSEASAGAVFSFILLSKHPLSHTASQVYNVFLSKDNRIADYERGRAFILANMPSFNHFVGRALVTLSRFYFDAHGRTRELAAKGFQSANMKIEEIINNPRMLFEFSASALEVPATAFSEHFAQHEIHPIGGNQGPLLQMGRSATAQDGHGRFRNRFDVYTGKSGLFEDRKWELILPSEAVHYIKNHSAYQRLVGDLGYSPYA